MYRVLILAVLLLMACKPKIPDKGPGQVYLFSVSFGDTSITRYADSITVDDNDYYILYDSTGKKIGQCFSPIKNSITIFVFDK